MATEAGCGYGFAPTRDDMDEMQQHFVLELAVLRDELEESKEENDLLRRKIKGLTVHLTDTTEELEHRMALYNDASAQVEKLEALVADAKKAILTREMRIHELTQEKQALDKMLETKDKEREHWEREFVAAKEDTTRASREQEKFRRERDEKNEEIAVWKAKLQLSMKVYNELKLDFEAMRTREVTHDEKEAAVAATIHQSEKRWKARLEKRDKTIIALEAELATLKENRQQVEDDKRKINEKEAEWRSNEAALQLDKRQQLLSIREELLRAGSDAEKAKMRELLMQRELHRLREELLLSESQRKTDQRRHDQLLRGKDKEMAFIWQKYVEAKCPSSARAHTQAAQTST